MTHIKRLDEEFNAQQKGVSESRATHKTRKIDEQVNAGNEEIWVRLGMWVETDKATMKKILKGDHQALRNAVEHGNIRLDGDTYIPAECVEDYNETYGTKVPANEINFNF